MHQVLTWLWDVVVNPVLDKLGFEEVNSSDTARSRVWWVGSGKLNILPIHAAGYHDKGSMRKAINRVISSYTPTIKIVQLDNRICA